MSTRERWIISGVLILIAVLVAIDIATDAREGVVLWHMISEAATGIGALYGVYLTLRGSYRLKKNLAQEQKNFSEFKIEAEKWRTDSRKYIDGLSLAIDQQLSKWSLTSAEKEVAFLLLKGLSLKEVADVRSTSEKTARTQSLAIYSKSGLSGRSELAAFFLEDLLVPQTEK